MNGWDDVDARPRLLFERMTFEWKTERALRDELGIPRRVGALRRLVKAGLVERTVQGDGVPVYRRHPRTRRTFA